MHSVNCVHGSGGVESLLRELRGLGVVLSIDADGRLAYDAPEPLGDALLSRLRDHRDGLLAAVEQFEERAAIVEHNAKLSRCDAERVALAEMLGEPVPTVEPMRPTHTVELVVEGVVESSVYLPVMSGVLCPWCRACEYLRTVDDKCLWCDNCDQLAFRFEGDAIVRADWVDQVVLDEGMPP